MKIQIQTLLAGIVKSLFGVLAEIEVTIPENTSNGDYTTNIAMILAGRLKAPPLTIGQQIVDAIKKHQIESGLEWLDRVEIVKPGFINLWLSSSYFGSQIAEVLEKKERYGAKLYEMKSEKLQVKSGEKTDSKKKPVLTAKSKSSQLPKLPQSPQFSSPSAGKDEKKGTLASFGNTESAIRDTGYVTRKKNNTSGISHITSRVSPKRIMVEFAHPNTHKAFHIGHLRNITTGESIVRLLESQGHIVIRANYQGDVGMHIAKCIYALLHLEPYKTDPILASHPSGDLALHIGSVKLQNIDLIHERVEFLGKAYAAGSKAFEESEEAKKAIGEINKQIYAKDLAVYPLYQKTRQWSLDYFDFIYKRVGSHFDRLYFESETYETGKKNVLEGLIKGVFQKSEGAIIFPGEKYGLHNRVFITREGNATYEGKDMGLAPLQHAEYHPDLILHVLGPEQYSYTRVMFQALDVLFPKDAGKQFHLVYGWVKLKSGKMSSRTGQVVLGEWLLDEAKKSIYTILDASASPLKVAPLKGSEKENVAEAAAIAAVKYAFLRVGANQEIAFDLKESISFDGDSGPYLLYTYARCKSVLRKAGSDVIARSESSSDAAISPNKRLLRRGNGLAMTMNPEERNLARRISQFPEVVADAETRFAPNTLCTYLFHLAQEFNLFYAKHSILSDTQYVTRDTKNKNESSHISHLTSHVSRRLALTAATAQVLKNGLYLLGIQTVERM